MGQYKAELNSYLYSIAEEVALRAGILAKCQLHEEVYDSGEHEVEEAYKLANFLITNSDPLVAPFQGDRTKLTDLIKGIRDNYSHSCPTCERDAED